MDDASSAGGEVALSDQEQLEKFSHHYSGVSSGHPFVSLELCQSAKALMSCWLG